MKDLVEQLVQETTERIVRRILPTLTDSTQPRLLSLEDSARYLDVSLTVLREMIARGELPSVRLTSKCVKCDRRDLDSIIDKHKDAA